jgi:hypothetical protein
MFLSDLRFRGLALKIPTVLLIRTGVFPHPAWVNHRNHQCSWGNPGVNHTIPRVNHMILGGPPCKENDTAGTKRTNNWEGDQMCRASGPKRLAIPDAVFSDP